MGIKRSQLLKRFGCEGLVDERPEMFGRLQFRAVGRQINRNDAVGELEPGGAVPAGIVEREHDDPLTTGVGCACECGEQFREKCLVDPVRQIPDGLPGRRWDSSGDIEPFLAMMAEPDRPPANDRPDPPTPRLPPYRNSI